MRNTISAFTVTVLTSMIFFTSGCKKADDFFVLPDTGGIDSDIWDTEPAIQLFLNRAYFFIMPTFPYEYTGNNYGMHLASDESHYSATDNWARRALGINGALAANDTRYAASKYQGSNIGDNRYYDIDRTNRGIVNIPQATMLTQESKEKFLGQFYGLRAIAYFNLTKIYGGMPLVLEPQNPSALTLSGRMKARDMFKVIVKDLDSSMRMLSGVQWDPNIERGKISRAAAAALKARALLYWASPQFNPVNDGAHRHEPLRWDTAFAAAKEAYDICIAAGHALHPNYADIFRVEGSNNKEAILVRSYSANAPTGNGSQNVEAKVRPLSENGLGGTASDGFFPSAAMINAYGMIDGRPISEDDSGYDNVLFWKNRDPRFEASIAYNGGKWALSGKNDRIQWTYEGALGDNNVTPESANKGFYTKRFSSNAVSFNNARSSSGIGGNGMDWIEIRFAEVVLNYAEAANETGNLQLAKDLVRQIRKRAGVVEGSFDYGLSLATEKLEMRELLANERMVEFAFEGKRPDDLRRLRKMQSLSGTVQGLSVKLNNSTYLSQLHRVTDVATGRRYRDDLDMNNRDTVSKYFSLSPVDVSGNGGYSVPEYFYFFSLHNQFLNSTPMLEQTIGWEGGTFDPLD